MNKKINKLTDSFKSSFTGSFAHLFSYLCSRLCSRLFTKPLFTLFFKLLLAAVLCLSLFSQALLSQVSQPAPTKPSGFSVQGLSDADLRKIAAFILDNQAPPREGPLYYPYYAFQTARVYQEKYRELETLFNQLPEARITSALGELVNTNDNLSGVANADDATGYGYSQVSAVDSLIYFGTLLRKVGIVSQFGRLDIAVILSQRVADINSYKKLGNLKAVREAIGAGLDEDYQPLEQVLAYKVRDKEVERRAIQLMIKFTRGTEKPLTRSDWGRIEKEWVSWYTAHGFLDIVFGGYLSKNSKGLASPARGDFLKTRRSRPSNIALDRENAKVDLALALGNELLEKLTITVLELRMEEAQ